VKRISCWGDQWQGTTAGLRLGCTENSQREGADTERPGAACRPRPEPGIAVGEREGQPALGNGEADRGRPRGHARRAGGRRRGFRGAPDQIKIWFRTETFSGEKVLSGCRAVGRGLQFFDDSRSLKSTFALGPGRPGPSPAADPPDAARRRAAPRRLDLPVLRQGGDRGRPRRSAGAGWCDFAEQPRCRLPSLQQDQGDPHAGGVAAGRGAVEIAGQGVAGTGAPQAAAPISSGLLATRVAA
jgi:hypothetical protein